MFRNINNHKKQITTKEYSLLILLIPASTFYLLETEIGPVQQLSSKSGRKSKDRIHSGPWIYFIFRLNMRFSHHILSLLTLAACRPLANEPLFEQSRTFHELIESSTGKQIITLKRYPSGQRAAAWKIEAFLPTQNSSLGSLLLFDSKGALVHEIEGYFEDKQFIAHGKWILFNSSEIPKLKAHFQNGILENEMVLFDSQGRVRCRKNFSKGLCHGPYILISPEGVPLEQGFFEKGLFSGSIWRFDDEGNVIEELPFSQGLPHGLCLTLDYQKKCQIRRYYLEGFLHRMDGPALERVRSDQSRAFSAGYRLGQPWGLWVYKDEQSIPSIIMEWKSGGEVFAYNKQNPSKKWFWKKGLLQTPCQIENIESKRVSSFTKEKEGFKLTRSFPGHSTCTSHWKLLGNNHLVLEGPRRYLDPQIKEEICETWKEGILIEKTAHSHLLQKRSQNGSLRLILKEESILEIEDPKSPGHILRAGFGVGGKLLHLESWPVGWQQDGLYQAHTSSEGLTYWKRQKNQLKICREDAKGHPLESFLIEKGIILQHSLYSPEGKEGDWSLSTLEKKPVNEIHYHKDRLEGSYKQFYPSGNPAYEGTYKKGLGTGVHRKCYDNGQIALSQEYQEGRAHGPCLGFDEKGEAHLKCSFENDLLQGKFWQKLSRGQIIEANFHKGRLQGVLKAYYPPSSPKAKAAVAFEGHYQKGAREGDFFDYHENGQLIQASHFKNNQIHGKLSQFHLNGQRALVAHYQEGKKEGSWQNFNEAGVLLRKAEFKNDWLEGNEQFFNAKGQLIAENSYLNDQLHGTQKRYNDQGELIYQAHYEKGQLHGAVLKYQKKTQTWIHSLFDHGQLIEKHKESHKDL